MKTRLHEVIILSGLSGSGKSSALNTLEDAGYFAIDNLPGPLFPALMQAVLDPRFPHFHKVALVMDAREKGFVSGFPQHMKMLRSKGIRHHLIFFDARDDVLLRRFSETRRRHPLSPRGSATAGIRQERDLLESVRSMAGHIIDTSYRNVHELKREVLSIARGGKTRTELAINLTSFGYRFGLPLDSDIVLDVRFLPNPYFVPSLKPLTGLSPRVAGFVHRQKITRSFLKGLKGLLRLLLDQYLKEGKVYLNIAFGCTGGRHRSVAVAEGMARDLKKMGHPVKIHHRDVNRE